jgi:hypothetical protein
MSEKINALKRELAAAEKAETSKKYNKQVELNKTCIGKAYKRISTGNYSTHINYVYVLDYVRYNDGRNMYGEDANHLISENLSISYGVGGYFLESGVLKYQGTNKRTHYPLKKHYEKGVVLEALTENHRGYFRPTQINENGSVYSDRDWYDECSVEEFNEVKEKIVAENKTTRENFKQYNTRKPYPNKLIEVTPLDIKLLSNLLQKVEDKKIDLKDYLYVAKKSADFIQFSNNELSELTQYNLIGTRGIHNTIEGGDDGTDYEPYTTKYVLHHVSIDWEKVLYTIRTKLDSVVGTADELRKLSAVYNTNNWYVSYDGQYDVSFNSCTLDSRILSTVNSVIKKHLKS